MKNIREEVFSWLQVLVPIAIWVVLIYAPKQTLSLDTEAFKKLPDVVTIFVLLRLGFTNIAWRWPIFRGWLVPYPDLQGTWKGTLQTTWKDPKTKKVPPPIPMILVITQSFDTISCVMHTQESDSFSTAAAFHRDDGDGTITLSYIYTNRPEVTIRGRSVIHDGAARLKVISKPKRELRGEYWTNRGTKGSISLKFYSEEQLEKFPDKR